jgi:hypothetical protein
MKKLGADETYQLWAATGDAKQPTIISAGVLGPNPEAAAFQAAGDVHQIMITVEKAPGVQATVQEPYASGSLA